MLQLKEERATASFAARSHRIWSALTLLCLAFYPSETHAYVDPGTGSILLQVLIGVAAAAMLFFKTQWSHVAAWFSRKPSSREESSSSRTEDAER